MIAHRAHHRDEASYPQINFRRSTFRDWVGDCTDYPSELAEIALAHSVGSKVEQAYRRGDMLEKRRPLMQEWADFLTQTP